MIAAVRRSGGERRESEAKKDTVLLANSSSTCTHEIKCRMSNLPPTEDDLIPDPGEEANNASVGGSVGAGGLNPYLSYRGMGGARFPRPERPGTVEVEDVTPPAPIKKQANIASAFAMQEKRHSERTPEEIEQARLANVKFQAMAKARLLNREKQAKMLGDVLGSPEAAGRPKVMHCNVFEGAMYTPVAASLYYWHNEADDLMSSVSDSTNLWEISRKSKTVEEARAKVHARIKAAAAKRAVQGMSSASGCRARNTPRNNITWTPEMKEIAVEALRNEAIRTYANGTPVYEKWTDALSATHKRLVAREDGLSGLSRNLLKLWYAKYESGGQNISALADQRNTNNNAAIVPVELLKSIDSFLLSILASNIEVDTAILRPFVLAHITVFDGGRYAHILEDSEGGGRVFKCSREWLRQRLIGLNKSWRKATNDSGKLPDGWEEELECMLVRVAYVVFIHDIPKALFGNMDETPLMWLARMGYTWGDRGASNVCTSGAKDKRQSTGTPWLSFLGEILFFHTTIKGKTVQCLPSPAFRAREEFKPPFTEIMFGHSENHWVTKQTMKDQVLMADKFRREYAASNGLDPNTKMLILWDVYCRHRDGDLREFMAENTPNLIVLFVPANLTEKGQPLDIYFNAAFKVSYKRLLRQSY